MKSIIAATALAATFSATTVAYAAHPLQPSGWPVPEAQTPYLTPEQREHRDFMSVQRETFPGNQPGLRKSRAQSDSGMARRTPADVFAPGAFNDDDARHRP
ncbi:MAG: hypothetical protein WBA66_15595 [Xanthobacteraceae bacterium]|jgi:hypothetical protein